MSDSKNNIVHSQYIDDDSDSQLVSDDNWISITESEITAIEGIVAEMGVFNQSSAEFPTVDIGTKESTIKTQNNQLDSTETSKNKREKIPCETLE